MGTGVWNIWRKKRSQEEKRRRKGRGYKRTQVKTSRESEVSRSFSFSPQGEELARHGDRWVVTSAGGSLGLVCLWIPNTWHRVHAQKCLMDEWKDILSLQTLSLLKVIKYMGQNILPVICYHTFCYDLNDRLSGFSALNSSCPLGSEPWLEPQRFICLTSALPSRAGSFPSPFDYIQEPSLHCSCKHYHLTNTASGTCFLRWHSGKEYPCQCRRHKKSGFDPWVWTILWRRRW